jgi:hypothetical protein
VRGGRRATDGGASEIAYRAERQQDFVNRSAAK